MDGVSVAVVTPFNRLAGSAYAIADRVKLALQLVGLLPDVSIVHLPDDRGSPLVLLNLDGEVYEVSVSEDDSVDDVVERVVAAVLEAATSRDTPPASTAVEEPLGVLA